MIIILIGLLLLKFLMEIIQVLILLLNYKNKLRSSTNFRLLNLFNVVYNSKNNNLTISIVDDRFTFKILTPDDLKTGLNNTFLQDYNKQRPN